MPSILQGFTAHILYSGSCSSYYRSVRAYVNYQTCTVSNDTVTPIASPPSDPITYTSTAGYRFQADLKCPPGTQVMSTEDRIEFVINQAPQSSYMPTIPLNYCSDQYPCFEFVSTDGLHYKFKYGGTISIADVFSSKNEFSADLIIGSTMNTYTAYFGYIDTTQSKIYLDGRAHPFDSAVRCNTASTYYVHFMIYDPPTNSYIYYVAAYTTSELGIYATKGHLIFTFPNFLKGNVKNGQLVSAVMISTSNTVTSYDKVVVGLVFSGNPTITDVSQLRDYINLGINVSQYEKRVSVIV